jgi:hypothetical protein
MERYGAENGGRQDKLAGPVEEGSPPTRKIFVTGGDEREAVRHAELVRGEGQPKVGLREGRDRGAKASCEILSNISRDPNGEEDGFVVIDRQASGLLEVMQDTLSMEHRLHGTLEEDEGIISVLKDRAGSIWYKRVSKKGVERRMLEKATKDVSNNDDGTPNSSYLCLDLV